MRKPTKLGYCTTCNAKIWIFDVNGIPFKRRDNYCEMLLQLSDGTIGKLAFCRKCVDKGFDAEEAIQNAVDGMREEISKKDWNQNFKDWHFGFYKDLKIMGVAASLKLKERGLIPVKDDVFEPLEKIGEVKNCFDGEIKGKCWKRPPLPYAHQNVEVSDQGEAHDDSSSAVDAVQ